MSQPDSPVPSLRPVPSSQPLTVVRLEVDAYKRLRAARLTPTPTGLVLVRGRNAQGKSSLIESMEAAFFGADAKAELPITQGEHGARVVADLGDLVVKRTWTRDAGGEARTRLVVESAAGEPFKGPQELLDSLQGRFADPVRFLGLKPEDQVRELLRALGLAEELERLETLAKGHYDRLREVGRDWDRARKAEAALDVEAGMFRDLPAGPAKSGGDLAAELQAANDHNAALDQWARARDEAERSGRTAAALVQRLMTQLVEANAALDAARQSYAEAKAVLETTPRVDAAPIHAEMAELADIERRRARIHVWEQAKAASASAYAEHQEVETALAGARAEIAKLLAAAKFPVEGMSYDPEAKQLLVNGIPLSQASHAERLKISVAVAVASSPRIRVAFIREGSMLDQESLALVARLADEQGFQVWCEVVDSKREGAGIWIEDGEASQPELEQAEVAS